MRIVMMNGGLGNQLFQYAFMRAIEIGTKEACFVDDSAFFGDDVAHNGFELEKVFGIKVRRLSHQFSSDVWEEMIAKRKLGYSIPEQLKEAGIDLLLITETEDYTYSGNVIRVTPNCVNEGAFSTMIKTQGSVYYYGYWWWNGIFVNLVKEVLQKELVFSQIQEIGNKEYEKLICNTNSCAIHIRRGDFVKCGRDLSVEKYAKSIEKILCLDKLATFFVFSDDIQWCREHELELGLDSRRGMVYYIDENNGNGRNYRDMQLMSLCKNMIISNSSFGTWAYFLNRRNGVNLIVADKL